MEKPVKVWSTFSRTSNDNNILNFRIEEVPDDRLEEVIDLFMNHYAKEETFQRAAGIHKSEEALKEHREIVMTLIKAKPHHVVICCLDDEPGKRTEYIGGSIMTLVTKNDKFENIELQTQELKMFYASLKNLEFLYNALESNQLDVFYDDRGVVVHPSYRGLGIATEFFKARRLICKEHGVSMTGAWMTAAGSQKAAARDDWETAFEISYEDLGRQLGVTFEDVPPTCKYMIARIK